MSKFDCFLQGIYVHNMLEPVLPCCIAFDMLHRSHEI